LEEQDLAKLKERLVRENGLKATRKRLTEGASQKMLNKMQRYKELYEEAKKKFECE
jgi:hypothetical protein